ncbi:hypothetical protein QYM36_014001 [Artemia franciscana]|uniref:RNase H type-1 domain-containing protein n=1 Tax=Artemia franciscana TaxID=6661 RepID=A0AA88HJI8_ARTSF|nr:hypothetical protein QYM36_014001 [Artemia franciscana]
MQFSKATILGKIDYASLVYASAKKTILTKLNAKWNETLRRTTNALKSTPIPALHIETSTTSLPTRRKILLAKYLLKKRGTEQEDIIKNEIIMDPYLMDYRYEIHNTPSLEVALAVAYGMIIKKLGTQYRLSDHTSIYMAEVFAIDTAIKEIVREGKEGKYLVCTDSLSCLKYLKVAHEQAPTMARDIVQNIRMIEETGSCVSLIWIPAHVGV